MICLHCAQPLDPERPDETKTRWHRHCIEEFFGTSTLPELTITDGEISRLVTTTVAKGYTVPGVQKKISLHLSGSHPSRLTLVGYPAGYIMKPQVGIYANLPEYEFVAMSLASAAGIQTVPFALYETNGQYVYLTKRIDRQGSSRLAMEDFCQLQGHLSEEKYYSSYEKCATTIKTFSVTPIPDLEDLFRRVIFSFVIGNSDLHLKNFSLIESAPGQRDYRLSPAYDILPVNLIEPGDADELALTLSGKKRHLTRKDFIAFAKSCDISEELAARFIADIVALSPAYESIIMSSPLTPSQKSSFLTLISARLASLVR